MKSLFSFHCLNLEEKFEDRNTEQIDMLLITLFWGLVVTAYTKKAGHLQWGLTFDGGSLLTPGWCIQHGGLPGVLPSQVPQ